MSEGFAFQANYKVGDSLFNVRGDDADEFKRNLVEAEGLAEQIAATGHALAGMPATTGQAVDNVRQEMGGGSIVGDGTTFNLGPLGTGTNSQREDGLASKGFVPDKWHDGPDQGGWWHPSKFPEAPACQCSGPRPNHGKLVLKVGMSQNGKEYTAWACANTFGKGAKSGCPNSFNGPFPRL
jgi:hypothetical protein